MEKAYEKSGCNDCKFYNSKWDWVDDKFTKVSQSCGSGFDERLKKWWLENGNKKTGKTSIMECHEWRDSTKSLIDLNNKASEILTLLKNS
jgi:hypothetical protein